MRMWIRRLLALGLAAVMSLGAAGAESLYAESAADVIRLYPQHRYWVIQDMCNYLCHIPLKTTDKTSNMCTSGCMLWAFVHAVEWCRQEKLYTNEAGKLVKEFVAANNAPWDVLYVVDECYHNVVRAHDIEVMPAPPQTEQEMIRFLQRRGAVICNMGGHLAVAMGCTYFDYDHDGEKDMMLHMLDSAMWSSADKQAIYDFRTFERIPYTFVCDGEFWLPFDAYVGMDRLAIAPMTPPPMDK